MKRRQFVRDLAVLGVAAGMAPGAGRAADDEPTARRIPRWRGFNLQGRFASPGHPYDGPGFEEQDFATMADWGFDFARLPLAYWSWGSRDDWSVIREEPLKQIDRAVELGRQHGIHVNINFHRIPGYCINGRELEPMDLFSGRKAERDRALEAAGWGWALWNLRGSFGVLDSERADVAYEDYKGRKLDRKMLELLKSH